MSFDEYIATLSCVQFQRRCPLSDQVVLFLLLSPDLVISSAVYSTNCATTALILLYKVRRLFGSSINFPLSLNFLNFMFNLLVDILGLK